MKKNKKIPISAQRAASHEALWLVTGSMPIHIKARLRWKEYEAKKCFSENLLGEVYDLMEELKNLKQEVEDKWILEWTFHNPCNWIRRLIRNPLILIRKKWKINHYVMQVLTGHGIFNHYRHRSVRRGIPVAGIVGTTWMMPSTCYLSAPDGWWRGLRLNPRWGLNSNWITFS